MSRLPTVAVIVMCLPVLLGHQRPPTAPDDPGSRTWIGRHQEFEEYLKTAECTRKEAFGKKEVFSNSNLTRCTLPPGGPVLRMAWKTGPPGPYRGFRVSYKNEIAAYELDKLLKLDMVPPTVERRLEGIDGAAQLWVEDVVDSAGEVPDESSRPEWDRQVAQMAMFDNLIGNTDRNRGNVLHDAKWNLILLDHSRAFGTGTELVHTMDRVDRDCWARMDGLTRGQLDAALRPWLGASEIGAILVRRDKMRTEVKRLPKE
jgi:hypothetical protein